MNQYSQSYYDKLWYADCLKQNKTPKQGWKKVKGDVKKDDVTKNRKEQAQR